MRIEEAMVEEVFGGRKVGAIVGGRLGEKEEICGEVKVEQAREGNSMES